MHEQHQYCQVFVSTQIIRVDSAKARSVVASLRELLLNLKTDVIGHFNITQNHLGAKELHLKEKADNT